MAKFNNFDPRLPQHCSIFNIKKANKLAIVIFGDAFLKVACLRFRDHYISATANIATNVVSNLAEEFLRLCLCIHGVHLTSFGQSQLSQKICHSIVSDQIVSSDTTARVKRSPNGKHKMRSGTCYEMAVTQAHDFMRFCIARQQHQETA